MHSDKVTNMETIYLLIGLILIKLANLVLLALIARYLFKINQEAMVHTSQTKTLSYLLLKGNRSRIGSISNITNTAPPLGATLDERRKRG